MPVFNEQRGLKPTIERLTKALTISVDDYEIVIIDDGSSDGTGELADEIARCHDRVRVHHNDRNMGLGFSYLRGIEAASKGSLVYIPGDNTWPYRSFVELFGNLGRADVVTSYSTNPGVRPPARRFVSRGYTIVLNTLFRHRLRYYNGLTIYPVDFLRSIRIGTHGFGFQAEVLLHVLHRRLSVLELALPIEERTAGSSKAVTPRNIASVIAMIARLFWSLRVRRWFGGRPSTQSGAQEQRPGIETMALGTGRAEFSPKRIVVTGASSGIGAALARSLSADGHQVYACARREERLRELAEECPGVRAHVCDVTREADVEALFSWIRSEASEIDVLITCAGGFGEIGSIENTMSERWLGTLEVNLFGTYLSIKHAIPLLERSADARILTLSGGGAFGPFPNYSAYACSKAAVVRLTECLAVELGSKGIAVNAIAPGLVATEAHEATLDAGPERVGEGYWARTHLATEQGGASVGEVVRCVLQLLSPSTRGLTGKTISVNFDPWETRTFREHIADIARSELWTMRRFNVANLPDGAFRIALAEAWASDGQEG